MSADPAPLPPPADSSARDLFRRLLPQMTVVAVMFLLTGAALAAVPLFVTRDLGLGPVVIGGITGLQFLCAIAARLSAGAFADQRGPKPALQTGLAFSVAAGALTLAAYAFSASEPVAITALALGRICLGGAEGFIMVGGQTWALVVAGPRRSALVLGWVGTAVFAAMAVGAPLGGLVYALGGFGWVGLLMTITPLLVMALLWRIPGVEAPSGAAMRMAEVARRIVLHSLTVALMGFSFAAVMSFSVLLFEARGWTPTWAALTLFSVALVVARIFLGPIPDRLGGIRSALWSFAVLAGGLLSIAFAPGPAIAFAGTFVTGLGYALVYPSLAREALTRVPDRNKGAAMAVFSSAIYLAIGLGGPLMGAMAESWTTAAPFVFAAVMALSAMAVILLVLRHR